MERHADPVALSLLGNSIVFHADQLRSLDLLKAIETAVNVLSVERRALQNYCNAVDEANAAIEQHGAECAVPLDPKGTVCKKFLEAQQSSKKLYTGLTTALSLSRENLADQEDLICELSETVPVVSSLHNGLNALRWKISQHDADVAARSDKGGKTYSSPQEIETYLRSI